MLNVNDIYNNYLECKFKSVFVLRYDKFAFLNNSLFFFIYHITEIILHT